MDEKVITFLDGSEDERKKAMKEFFGLSPEQDFQDIKIEDDETAK